MEGQGSKRAVFLDRDGTLNVDTGHVFAPEDVVILPGVPEGLASLAARGFTLLVTTNQSGVARGHLDLERVEQVNRRIAELLSQYGIVIAGWYVCPHHVQGTVDRFRLRCDCRKPLPGLLIQAAADHGIDLAKSYAVGDRERDVAAGHAAGCRTVLLSSPGTPTTADATCRDLREAGLWIAGDSCEPGEPYAPGLPASQCP